MIIDDVQDHSEKMASDIEQLKMLFRQYREINEFQLETDDKRITWLVCAMIALFGMFLVNLAMVLTMYFRLAE